MIEPVLRRSDLGQKTVRTPGMSRFLSWRGQRRIKKAARILVALFAFVVLFYWIGGLGDLSIHRPFEYWGDSLEMISYHTRDVVANDFDTRMRAPFELAKPENSHYLYNALFQSNSYLTWIAKLLGGGGPVQTLNLAYLFSFLLVFVTAYWTCGYLGLREPFRFFASSLYSLMPYHYQRAENHFFESCYYFTPLMALLVVALWSARPLGCQWQDSRWRFTWRDSRLWLALFLLTFLTPFNAYHQFFFAWLAGSAAPFAAIYRKNWRPLVIGCGLAVFACAVLLLKHALARHLASPELALGVTSQPISGYGSAEAFPLKLTQLLLPVEGHRWSAWSGFRHMYDVSNPLNNENSTTTLGFVGAIGLLSCMVLTLVPVPRLRTSRAGKMGLIVLMAILFASMGGVGSLISTISAAVLGPNAMLTQARGWDRIAVFIGFFSYFTAFWLLQLLAKEVAPRLIEGWRQTASIWVAGAAIFAFALWDQVPNKIAQQHAGHYRSDVAFFGSLEKDLPPNSRIFQLPFVIHHHSGWVRPGVYYTDQLRPYITTRTLHFTYGGDYQSAQSKWLQQASALSPDQAAPYLCRYGFAGVLIQRNMLEDAAGLENQWQATLGEMPEFSQDRDYSFFELQNFCRARGIQAQDTAPLKARPLQYDDYKHFKATLRPETTSGEFKSR